MGGFALGRTNTGACAWGAVGASGYPRTTPYQYGSCAGVFGLDRADRAVLAQAIVPIRSRAGRGCMRGSPPLPPPPGPAAVAAAVDADAAVAAAGLAAASASIAAMAAAAAALAALAAAAAAALMHLPHAICGRWAVLPLPRGRCQRCHAAIASVRRLWNTISSSCISVSRAAAASVAAVSVT